MALEAKEILEFIFGEQAKDIDSIEKVKAGFSGENALFVPVSDLKDDKSETFKKFVPKAVGLIAGRSTSALKKRLNELDIDLTPDEIKDKPLEEIIDLALSKTVSTVKNKFTDYDNKLKLNTDERVSTLNADLEKERKKHNELQELHGTLKTTYETEVSSHKNQLKTFKLQTLLDKQQREHIKFGSTVKDLEKDGYFARLEKKYKFDLNDKGDDIEVLDASTGSRIANPKQAGSFMTYKDVLEKEGLELNVWATNEKGKKNTQHVNAFGGNTEKEQPTPGERQRKVSSRLS